MKNNPIISAIFLIVSLGMTTVVVADSNEELFSEQKEMELFGTFDAIYPEESRIIVDDTSFKYHRGILFLNNSGHRLSNPVDDLKIGTPVQIHYIDNSPEMILKDLKIISKHELKQSRRMKRDE